ncbi:transcriptional regulator [Xanthomonas campestris]|nr:transcriptional regulator [Xanthomonas campestris pv. incanae]WDJ09957.1 transcriptional regulator [Xanthomonas campestris pv. incanae]WDJ89883.1 transcriptional regulator [Xanthomonas campestris]
MPCSVRARKKPRVRCLPVLQRLSNWKALFATSTAGLLRCPRANIHQVSASPPRCRRMFPATVQFWDTSLEPKQAVELALRRSARMQCERGHPKGCMVTLGVMSTPSPEFSALSAPLTRSRAHTRAGIRACVDRAIANGSLAAGLDAAALTCVFDSFMLGLSTLARDGKTFKAMDAAITQLMHLWDMHAR